MLWRLVSWLWRNGQFGQEPVFPEGQNPHFSQISFGGILQTTGRRTVVLSPSIFDLCGLQFRVPPNRILVPSLSLNTLFSSLSLQLKNKQNCRRNTTLWKQRWTKETQTSNSYSARSKTRRLSWWVHVLPSDQRAILPSTLGRIGTFSTSKPYSKVQSICDVRGAGEVPVVVFADQCYLSSQEEITINWTSQLQENFVRRTDKVRTQNQRKQCCCGASKLGTR